MRLNWKKVKEEKYQVNPHRRMLKRKFIFPDETEADYDILDIGTTASVVAFTKANKIVLIKIFRPGPEKVLAEIPGGFVDEGEKPEEAAKRELLEETGYSGDFEFVSTSVDDAYSNCVRFIFVAKNCKKVQRPKREFDEFMEVVEMTLEQFRNHLRSGELTDVELGYLALDHLN